MITLKLNRREYRDDGIFSELTNAHGDILAHTVEHSYKNLPKLYVGTFKCKRGTHQLHTGPKFETFEITGVNGHTNILFHKGNWQSDSEGCVLLGEGIAHSSKGQMVTNSTVTFKHFMSLLDGVDEFTLVVY